MILDGEKLILLKMAVATDDDSITVQTASTLIFGIMGVGTFIVFFFLVVLAAVWFISYSCDPQVKSLSRAVAFLLFFITTVFLIYAPKTQQYTTTGYEENVYDHSIIPRIAVSLVIMLFGIVSVIFLFGHFAEPKKLSTMDHEYTELWQVD